MNPLRFVIASRNFLHSVQSLGAAKQPQRQSTEIASSAYRPPRNNVRLFILIPLLTLVTAACAAQPTPSATSTATARPTNTPAPTATRTLVPTSTPTPTPQPEKLMKDAAQAMHDGDYAAALQNYQALIGEVSSADLVEQASLNAANIQLKSEHVSEAVGAFLNFTQKYTDTAYASAAWFQLGEAYLGQSTWAKSIEAYQKYLDLRGDVIGSYVQERIGDAYSNLKDFDNAAAAYLRSIQQATSSSDEAGLREKLALTYRLLTRYDAALAQYSAILGFAQNASYQAQVIFQLGQTYLDAGRRSEGFDQFQRLVNYYYDRPEAYQALVALLDSDQEVNEFYRGVTDTYAKQSDAAIAAFNRFIQSTTDHGNAHYYSGLAYRSAGNIAPALKAFDAVITDHLEASHWGDAWIEKANTQAINGDMTGALNTLTTFVKKYPTNPLASTALWNAAGLLESVGNYQRAIDLNLQLQKNYPSDQNASESLYDAGLDAYRINDLHTAITAWQTLSNTYPLSNLYAGALLWQAKALQKLGQDQPARQMLFQSAQNTTDYFGLRAQDVLSHTGDLPIVLANLNIDPDEGRTDAEAWLAKWLGVDVRTLQSVPVPIIADGRFQRGEEFWRLDRFDRARDEYEALRFAYADNPAVMYSLAIYFRDIGLYRSSILCAGSVIRMSPAGSSDHAPIFLARLAYPIYYANLVGPEAQERSVDPLVIYALIRQESLFEGIATSSAFANGLMQIIPSTAVEIAHALQWPNYQISDLYRPLISIKFGVYYLARQRDYLEGDVIAAWAAYNGGPGNAKGWRDAANGDVDLFVENISLAETRLYIERLRENLAMYQRLYASDK
jgi:soluble lytic murein transglycosylase